MQRKILIDALNKSTATDSLIPGKAPATPPRPMDPSQGLQEEKIVYHITIDDLNIHEIFEHSLATMIRNRRELIKEIFSILAPHEIKAMLPESFRELKPKEVMKLCYMQLKEMPENHLTAIITCLADPTQCTIPVYKTMPKSKRSDSPSWRISPKQPPDSHDKVRDRSRSPTYKLDKTKINSPKRTTSHPADSQRHKSSQEKRGRESTSKSSPSKRKSDKSPKKTPHKYSGENSKSKSESDRKRLASSVHTAAKSSNSRSRHHSSSKDKKQKKS